MGHIDFHKDERFSSVAYDEPTVEVIKELSRFLRNNKAETVRLYHGTAESIPVLDEGLKPTTNKTKRSLQSTTGYVYLSIYPGMAKTFGEIAYPGKKINIYAVDVPVSLLKADTDQLNNKRYWGGYKIGNTLAESIAYGHGVRVKGKIEVNKVKLYELNKVLNK
jgi:CMP-2-keto-3-deoxyoctulosonic acid synthetase